MNFPWKVQPGLSKKWNSTVLWQAERENGFVTFRIFEIVNGQLFELRKTDKEFKDDFSRQNCLANDDSEETLEETFSVSTDMLNRAEETGEVSFKEAIFNESSIKLFLLDSNDDLEWQLSLPRSSDFRSLIVPMAVACATYSRREEMLLKNITLRDDKLEKYLKKHGELDHADGWIYGATKRFSPSRLEACKPVDLKEAFELSASSLTQFASVIESVSKNKQDSPEPSCVSPTTSAPVTANGDTPQNQPQTSQFIPSTETSQTTAGSSLPSTHVSPSKRPKKNAIR